MYEVEQRGEEWVVINTETQEVKGTHDTEEEAKRQLRILNEVEHRLDGEAE